MTSYSNGTLFENYNNGDHLAVDVTVISPFRGGLANSATTTYLFTGNKVYLDKLDKYKDFTFKQGITFQPFVVEEFGLYTKNPWVFLTDYVNLFLSIRTSH